MGSLAAEDLAEELTKSTIYIHPSHIENSPNSVCEAMLTGMPVIATLAGGIPSIVDNLKEGILVQDGDPYALAGAIVELLKDPGQARKLGETAREKALSRHRPENIINQLTGIYSRILNTTSE